ncbi:MAG: hypothetical protein Q7U86_05285 [Draconibacterium sp.]|nr:hypothetical protein [Draconibacterium sp.]
MKHLLLIFIFTCFNGFAFSQEFKQAVGIRAGFTGGVEYRIYADELNSYKFLFGSRDRGLIAHAMKEWHQHDLFTFTDQLTFVYGAGLHVGYERWDQQYYNYNTSYYVTRTAFIAGLDGLAGLEYMFLDVPLSVGFEVKPYFDFFGREMFDIELFDFALTVKYHF